MHRFVIRLLSFPYLLITGALDGGGGIFNMSILRKPTVALSNLRNAHVALSHLRNIYVPCHYHFNSHVACHYGLKCPMSPCRF